MSEYAPLTFLQICFILGRIVRGWRRIHSARRSPTPSIFKACTKWRGVWIYCWYAKMTWQTCRPFRHSQAEGVKS